jgi:flagella basal body P-ring formation protein FlgA
MKYIKENSSGMTGSNTPSRMKVVVSVCTMVASIFFVSNIDAFEIVLKPVVSIQKEEIVLKDLLTESSRAMCDDETVLMTSIARAPRPGESRQISRALVALKLKNNHIDISEYSFSGALRVAVERQAQILEKNVFENFIYGVLDAEYQLAPTRVRLEIENIKDHVILPFGEYQLSYEKETVRLQNGYVHLRIVVSVNGEVNFKKLVSVKLFEEREIVVAKNAINVREIIHATDLTVEKKYVPYGALYLTKREDVQEKIANVNIPAGSAIQSTDLKDRPTVYKGDTVNATIVQKNMTVKLKLKALENGQNGSQIRLFSEETRKNFIGKVVGEGVVEVSL